jgi:hypothetical protein
MQFGLETHYLLDARGEKTLTRNLLSANAFVHSGTCRHVGAESMQDEPEYGKRFI